MVSIDNRMTRAEEIIEKAIETYGSINQCIVAMEEMAELQKELSKAIRGEAVRENIVEEIADVEIMLQQIMRVFEINKKEVLSIKKAKLTRLEQRLKVATND